jgi:hypothetical protein
MDFKAVNDRISMLRVRGKFFNITPFSLHAPTEEKEAAIKGCHLIVLGHLNAKTGEE